MKSSSSLISYNPRDQDLIFSEVLSTLPCEIKYLDVEILCEGIKRPIDLRGYLDVNKLDVYLQECLDKKVIPFSHSILADSGIKDDCQIIDQSRVSPLVPYGVIVEEDIRELIEGKRFSGYSQFSAKITEAVRYAQMQNFRAHIHSVSTAEEGSNLLRKMWGGFQGLTTIGTIGTAIMSPLGIFHGKRGFVGARSPKISIIFGTEESPVLSLSYESGLRDYSTGEFDKVMDALNPWWNDLVSKYHDNKFISKK